MCGVASAQSANGKNGYIIEIWSPALGLPGPLYLYDLSIHVLARGAVTLVASWFLCPGSCVATLSHIRSGPAQDVKAGAQTHGRHCDNTAEH